MKWNKIELIILWIGGRWARICDRVCARARARTTWANDSSVYISFKSHFETIFGRSQLFSVSVSSFSLLLFTLPHCCCVPQWRKIKFIVAFVEIQTSEGKETMTKQDNDDGDYSNSSSHNSDADNNIATEKGECQVNRNQRVWNAYLRIYSS